MHVELFVTCLVDQCWPEVGIASVRLLRRAGCTVSFDSRQTCCGQPAFNTGYRNEARAIAERTIAILEESRAEAIVLPSGSCAAMFGHFGELFHDDPAWRVRASSVAARTFELGAFLVNHLGKDDFGARFPGRVTWHDACHGLRDLGLHAEARRLLAKVEGLTLVEASQAATCCGFGGTFSVKHPEVSVAMAERKIEEMEALEVDAVVSGDVSCLLQIGGALSRRGSKVRPLHLAELLACGVD